MSDPFIGHLGPPDGNDYFATGTSGFHGGAPCWVHSGGKLADVAAAAAQFVIEGMEFDDPREVSVWFVADDGKTQPDPLVITWKAPS